MQVEQERGEREEQVRIGRLSSEGGAGGTVMQEHEGMLSDGSVRMK